MRPVGRPAFSAADQLAGAEDQHVLVVDRRPSPHRRRDRDLDPVVLVAQTPDGPAGWQAKTPDAPWSRDLPSAAPHRGRTERNRSSPVRRSSLARLDRLEPLPSPARFVVSVTRACQPPRRRSTTTLPPPKNDRGFGVSQSWDRSRSGRGFGVASSAAAAEITASVQTLAKPRLRRNRFNNHKLTRQPCPQRHSAARRSPTKRAEIAEKSSGA